MDGENANEWIGIFFLFAIFVAPIIWGLIEKIKKDKALKQLSVLETKFSGLSEEHSELIEKYKPVTDAKSEADRIVAEAESLQKSAKSTLAKAKSDAELHVSQAKDAAHRIVEDANARAFEIAGSAIEAKEKADSYESAIKAMKNAIEGYKDDYIVPNLSVLDDLAEDFGHKDAGEKLKFARSQVRNMVKANEAGECDYSENTRRTYAIHFAVDAFNGKVDSALSKVKHDNFGKIKQEIIDAFALVNHNGAPFRNARIRREYLDARLEELKWAVATYELQKQEKEEQKEIRDQIREEERAQREMEKAIKAAEKEERLLQEAMEKARKELEGASDAQRQKYEDQLLSLKEKLKEAEERGQRALSMAQQTRRGHVYVISNIGSFGENIYKVGMTRRLEPKDRVKELGDASVPFDFDIHAMIYSEDAPALEREMHKAFDLQSVNKVNPRKEFFEVSIADIRSEVEAAGYKNVHWTMKAEAAEYRESLSISKKQEQKGLAISIM
ncbi:DUF4041 domain-containing protein [Alcanivorax sediminis]|uniref:DUF4041 domain-containing protein n=1 Tax=Alcanivorax sediminis TaxID=2663008 RepID=A0A6N7LSI9_9GAMM|nr:DUF4041 domain-containing protein [Alcanivorax sediminis]MQX52134.1 DUF4041 domain-containing protein [Alcanivorax sediminis]